jgi:hypothetical protein
VDSDCIGSRVAIADESTFLMMVQSAAETVVETGLAATVVAGADVAGGALVTLADAAAALDELELLQAARATQAAPTASAAIACLPPCGLVGFPLAPSTGRERLTGIG